MTIGTVIFFDKNNGFGNIKAQNEARNLFFHESQSCGTLNPNDLVKYETSITKAGLVAINVKKLNED